MCHEQNHDQSRSTLFVSSAVLYNTYLVLLQLLFVFVSGTFLVNNVLAKPLYVENLDGTLGHFERAAELQHPSVNETSQSRGKRDVNVLNGLQDLCPGKESKVSPKPGSGCVRKWLYCHYNHNNLIEPQCDSLSLRCLPSVARFGFPKCKPVYNWTQITLTDGQTKRLKLNSSCVCAWWLRKEERTFIYLFMYLLRQL